MDLSIIPECFVDTNLIETLVPPQSSGYNHQKGCPTVAKTMKESFTDSFAVGIIDRDKRQLDYLTEFTIVHQIDTLILHKHKNKHHYIIQICPALEQFLLVEAYKSGVSFEQFGLPTEMKRLTSVTKTANSKKDPRFKGLIKAIRKSGSSQFEVLASWVSYLKDNNYHASIEDLKNL